MHRKVHDGLKFLFCALLAFACKSKSSNLKNDESLDVSVCINCHKSEASLATELKSPESLRQLIPYMTDFLYENMLERAAVSGEGRKTFDDARGKRVNEKSYFKSSCDKSSHKDEFPTIETKDSPLASELVRIIETNGLNAGPSGMRPWQATHVPDIPEIARIKTLQTATNKDMYDLMGYHSDGSREFPWEFSAGLDISPQVVTRKYFAATSPIQLGIKTKATNPEAFGTNPRLSSNVKGPQLGWRFAPETFFAEILSMNHGGVEYPFEIRIRKKVDVDLWVFDVLRPFADVKEYNDALRKICNETGTTCESMLLDEASASVMPVTAAINKQTFQLKRDPLVINNNARHVVQSNAAIVKLKPVSPDIVTKLLRQSAFKSVYGKRWTTTGNDSIGWAAWNDVQDFHIVPKNYLAAFVPLTRNSCMNCHDAAGRHVNRFDPVEMNARAPGDAEMRVRTWYHFIPGDDFIFSFHPYSPTAVAKSSNIFTGPTSTQLTAGLLDKCYDNILSKQDGLASSSYDTKPADTSNRDPDRLNGSSSGGSDVINNAESKSTTKDWDDDRIPNSSDRCDRTPPGFQPKKDKKIVYLGCAESDVVTD